MANYYFFFSYARQDSGEYLKRFYEDLTEEVRGLTGVENPVGFLDRETLELGAAWPPALLTSLNNSQVLVSIYSPIYFTRPYCGVEWQAFSERIDAYLTVQPPGTTPPALILPVLWRSLDQAAVPPPSFALNLMLDSAQFPEMYAKSGLLNLMKQHPAEYRDFVIAFAQKVIEAAKSVHSLPKLSKDIGEVRDAFHGAIPEQPQLRVSPPESQPAGPKVARFAFLAACREELVPGSRNPKFYGDYGRDWTPYLGASDDVNGELPVGLIGMKAAYAERIHFEPLTVDTGLVDMLKEAEKQNVIVIIIADPWTIHLIDEYRSLMEQYDEINLFNCAVVIPWNDDDEETLQQSVELDQHIQQVFFRNIGDRKPFFCHPVRSREELERELGRMLCEVRRRILERGTVFQHVGARQALPRISGPVGATLS